MIIELTGGLGNQMFQYAYGRAISLKDKKKLYYYFSSHSGDTKREYELNVFNITGKKINNPVINIFTKFANLPKIRIPGVKRGYWQSEKYFIDFEKQIRNDFKFTRKLNKKNRGVLSRIMSTNSISIHVRRGDYVLSKKTNKFHGILPLSFYTKAIEIINNRIINPLYFVFSDDPIWVKNNIVINNAVYIDWNKGKNSFVDMQLMSRCKHNIIANSSFSWWGAWLNNNPDKIVVAPKQWFKDADAQKSTINLLPKTWKKI